MTNTFEQIEGDLINAINDEHSKVIALTGKWGTGKTFLWKKVRIKMESDFNNLKKPIYISIFGAKSINELKLRIMQNIYLDDVDPVNKYKEVGFELFKAVVKKYTDFSITDASLLLVLPQLASGRLIVIDDVERKHKSLDIDELLGFLDEYSKLHKVKFLVILNTDQLADADIWKTLHEKVIDFDIKLTPTAAECFDIAFIDSDFPYLNEVRESVSILKLNNIRVIERILRNVQRIYLVLGDKSNLTTNWISSTALLTACYFKAVENLPTFEYIKSFSNFRRYIKKESPTSNELEWELLMEKLNILESDEYEIIFQEFLISGNLNKDRLITLFNQYSYQTNNFIASTSCNEFCDAYDWNPNLSDCDLLNKVKNLLNIAGKIKPHEITTLISIIETLGDIGLARNFLDVWLQEANSRPEYQQLDTRSSLDHDNKLHPEVIAKLLQLRDQQNPPLALNEAIDLLRNSNWGDREINALKESTLDQYKEALEKLNGEKLRVFLVMHLAWIQENTSDEIYKHCSDNFIAACGNIVKEAPDSRLAAIIKRVFQSWGLIKRLGSTSLNIESD